MPFRVGLIYESNVLSKYIERESSCLLLAKSGGATKAEESLRPLRLAQNLNKPARRNAGTLSTATS